MEGFFEKWFFKNGVRYLERLKLADDRHKGSYENCNSYSDSVAQDYRLIARKLLTIPATIFIELGRLSLRIIII